MKTITELMAENEKLRAELEAANKADMFWDSEDTEQMVYDVEQYPNTEGWDIPDDKIVEIEFECAKRLTNKFARYSWNEEGCRFELIGLFDEILAELEKP